MTLLIACLLIYHLDAPSWWYAAAVGVWLLRAWFIDVAIRSNVEAVIQRGTGGIAGLLSEVNDRIQNVEQRVSDNFQTEQERQDEIASRP